MLLKVVASDPTASSSPPSGEGGGTTATRPPPLYVNLQTNPAPSSQHPHHGGTILTAGRKNCDTNFGTDKGVSRSHLRLRLIKGGVDTPPGTPEEGEGGDGGGADGAEAEDDGANQKNQFMKPRSAEEIAATENSADGIALVLEDMGSKFGSTVVYEVPDHDSNSGDAKDGGDDDGKNKKKGGDESETDDETDDEGLTPAPNANAKRQQPGSGGSGTSLDSPDGMAAGAGGAGGMAAGGMRGIRTKTIRKKLNKNESVILTSLSLPIATNDGPTNLQNPSSSTNPSSSGSVYLPTVTIHLGAAIPPTSTLTITRIPLNLCSSRIPPATKSRLTRVVDRVGATLSGSWSFATTTNDNNATTTNSSGGGAPMTTHLITPTRIPTAKTIMAWCLRTPIVTADYVDALVSRTCMSAPLPSTHDYMPSGDLPMDAVEDDQESNDDPSIAPPRDPLRGFTVLSLVSDGEGEQLVRAAGARVVQLADVIVNEQTFHDGKWLDELQSAYATNGRGEEEEEVDWNHGGTIFLIDTSSRKVRKHRDYLVKRRNIKTVTQKEIAAAISELRSRVLATDGTELIGREFPRRRSPIIEEEEEPQQQKTKAKGKGGSGSGGAMETIQEVSREDYSREESHGGASASAAAAAAPAPAPAPTPTPPKDDEEVVPTPGAAASASASAAAQEEEEEEFQPPMDDDDEEIGGDDDARRENQETSVSRGKRKRRGGRGEDEGPKEEGKKEEADDEPKAEHRSKRSKTRDNEEREQPTASAAASAAAAATKTSEDGPTEGQPSRTAAKRKRRADRDDDDDDDLPTTSNPNKRRRTLPKKKNGWLTAAPAKSSARAAFKSTTLDLADRNEVLQESALTERVSGLIVRTDAECRELMERARSQPSSQRANRAATTRRDGGKPARDFKRFRKNAVIRGNTSAVRGGYYYPRGGGGASHRPTAPTTASGLDGTSCTPIRMRSVLPKETERQRQLELAQRELEKSQREADALFNDPVDRRGGGLKSYFKSTTGKRKTTKARVRR